LLRHFILPLSAQPRICFFRLLVLFGAVPLEERPSQPARSPAPLSSAQPSQTARPPLSSAARPPARRGQVGVRQARRRRLRRHRQHPVRGRHQRLLHPAADGRGGSGRAAEATHCRGRRKDERQHGGGGERRKVRTQPQMTIHPFIDVLLFSYLFQFCSFFLLSGLSAQAKKAKWSCLWLFSNEGG
jgi:hypothetical protein